MKENISFNYRLLTKGDLLPVRSQGKYCFVVKKNLCGNEDKE